MSDKQDKPDNKEIRNFYNVNLPSMLSRQGEDALINCCLGRATPSEQRLALATICYSFSNLNMPSFNPDSDRMTAYEEGKRSVGIKILAFLNKYNLENNG